MSCASSNLKGEIDWPASQPVGHIDFNVSRPNGAAQVRVDLNAKHAYVKEFENSALHAFQIFHTFSGSRFNQPASRRDWIVTSVWVFAMDALAAGLIVMVLGSYYMWWRLKKRKTLGLATLFLGVSSCAMFVAGVLEPSRRGRIGRGEFSNWRVYESMSYDRSNCVGIRRVRLGCGDHWGTRRQGLLHKGQGQYDERSQGYG